MDTPFHLEVHPTYLHLKYPSGFVISPETSGETWNTVGNLCRQYGCTKVLIEGESPERHLDTMSAFESGRLLAENVVGVTLAVCLRGHEFDELSAFFKTVAQNRGVKIEFFTNLDEARRWLDVDTGENAAGSP
jgi:hypothetical protein